MAGSSAPKSLDEMLQADRKKRKAEKLAQKIFGNKDRRQSAPATQKELKPQSPGASFASRVGINKRSASSSSVNRQKQPGRPNPPSALSRSSTVAKLESAVSQDTNSTSASRKRKAKEPNGQVKSEQKVEISIRGAAGPYTVVAENFAPGTSAADIETVISGTGGPMESCELSKSDHVSVTAEMVFLDKKKVDEVVSTFNGQKADGFELKVYLKKPVRDSGNGLSEVNPWRVDSTPAVYPASDQAPAVEEETMEVDHGNVEPSFVEDGGRRGGYEHRGRGNYDRSYEHDYRRDDRRGARRDDRRDERRPDLMYQDGRQGFGEHPPAGPRYDRRQEPWRGGSGRMYSDDIVRRSGPPPSRRW
ncbi:hypothetical protein KVT40_005719 [Elsinoe batatas]|uniref:RRM domain-containing protein n=1 Tax=Elsinoe batatas TaxID=2601811 RepID=A0A8K0PIM0_9PEZI|nr:hypothetical protein KVT40_005719 [Elsinoe batatas]